MTEVLRTILKHVRPECRLWPCLVGPTGSGKTARAHALAESLGVPLQVLLPGTCLPEDILGLPKVVRGRTIIL